MARPLRLHIPGALYHVISRGNARQPIFLDAEDYTRFLIRLSVTSARFDVRCRAHCLMPNHVHLLLQPHQFSLSRMMQQLNSSYCEAFNERHGRVGHVLQGRFKAPMIDGDAYFRRVLLYIVLNPVRAGIVAHPAAWPWSSYRPTAGLEPRPSFLDLDPVWKAFDSDRSVAQRLYAGAVNDAPAEPEDLLTGPIAYGSESFRTRVAETLDAHRDERDVVYAERFACRPSLERLFVKGVSASALQCAMRNAFERHGYTLREIGNFVGRPPSTVWRRIHRSAGPVDVINCHQNGKIEI